MPELYRAVYCSRRCLASYDPLLDHEIEEILAASRKNNARDGLTGALLFSLGSFAQALEGPLTVLNATLERIKADPRHDEIRVLEFGPVPKREFPDWSMAFVGVGHDVRLRAIDALAGKELLDLLLMAI